MVGRCGVIVTLIYNFFLVLSFDGSIHSSLNGWLDDYCVRLCKSCSACSIQVSVAILRMKSGYRCFSFCGLDIV